MDTETAGETPALPALRDPDGKWLPGQSGNPKGRPPVDPEIIAQGGTKHKLTQLSRKLEIAVRENVDPRKIAAILDKMCDMALQGNVRAAKLVLDKTISNASGTTEDEAGESQRQVIFKIENATFAAVKQVAEPAITVEVIPVTPSEEPSK